MTRVQEILKEVSGIKKVDYRKDNNLMTTAQIETRNAKDIREEDVYKRQILTRQTQTKRNGWRNVQE